MRISALRAVLKRISILHTVVTIGCIGLFPIAVHAGRVGVFFSGHCLGSQTCIVGKTAPKAINAKLASGAPQVFAPDLEEGNFKAGELDRTLKFIANHEIVFIAYSGGYKALAQIVPRMSDDQKKQTKEIVSLEADYPSFRSAVAKIQKVNPSVKVHYYNQSQFKGASHASLPTDPRVAASLAGLIGDDGTGVTPPPPPALRPPEPPPMQPPIPRQPLGGQKSLFSSLFGPSQPASNPYSPNSGLLSPFSSFTPPPSAASPFAPTPSALSSLQSFTNPQAISSQVEPRAPLPTTFTEHDTGTVSSQAQKPASVVSVTISASSTPPKSSTFEEPKKNDTEVNQYVSSSVTTIQNTLTDILARVQSIVQSLVGLIRQPAQ